MPFKFNPLTGSIDAVNSRSEDATFSQNIELSKGNKVRFLDGGVQKGYIQLDLFQKIQYWCASGHEQEFYAGGNVNLSLGSGTATFAGNIYVKGGGTASKFETNANGAKIQNTTGAAQLNIEGGSGSTATLQMSADAKEDNADTWRLQAEDGSNFTIGSYSTGAWLPAVSIAGSRDATFAGDIKIESTMPRIWLTDTNSDSDFSLYNGNGTFTIKDETTTALPIRIYSGSGGSGSGNAGAVQIDGNLDAAAGIDVTGLNTTTKSSTDTNFYVKSLPATESGSYVLNSSQTNGAYSSVGIIAVNASGTDQSASIVSKSSASGYRPDVYITQRTNANANTAAFEINTSGACTLNYDGSSRIRSTSTGADVYSNAHDGGLRIIPKNNNQESRLHLQGKAADGTDHDWYLSAQRNSDIFSIHNGTNSWLTIADAGATTFASNVFIGSHDETNPAGVNTTGGAITFKRDVGTINANAVDTTHKLGRTTDGQIVSFYSAGGHEGTISISGSTTTYATSSDYRLKENEVAISDSITRLKTLKPYRFNFKKNTSKTLDGFFAHEVQEVVPEAVTGTKDEVDSNGDPIIQGIDQSKLVPLLTAALQEAIAKIETLETKVAALESA